MAVDRKIETEKYVTQVRDVLNGKAISPDEAYALAEQLNQLDAHHWARRLLAAVMPPQRMALADRQKLAQALALATYKDQTLLRDDALQEAHDVLASAFDLQELRDEETFGLLGAIQKRRWRLDGNRRWLEESLHYYRQAWEKRGQLDKYEGYSAVNAAFILELLADLDDREDRDRGVPPGRGDQQREQARQIRQSVVNELEDRFEAEGDDYWHWVTIAEANFGLGNFRKAGEQLHKATQVACSSQQRPEWKHRSTVEQFTGIARLQLGSNDPAVLRDSEQWQALQSFITAEQARAVETLFSGKVGLALSGGGFRASLYHLGVLARLAEADMLRHVEVLSCVSGGSIVGAHYYLELRRLMQFETAPDGSRHNGLEDGEIRREDYLELVERLITDFLAGVQKNLRVRVAANPCFNFRMLFSRRFSRTHRLGDLYERYLYARVKDHVPPAAAGRPAERPAARTCHSTRRPLKDLLICPPDEEKGFRPSDVNWRRINKVPQLILNATTLNTGHVWQFTASWMGESPNLIDRDVDTATRLRRMYYGEAPKEYQEMSLGHAVAASSCVPGLFEPLHMPDLYPDIDVRLVDGGVHDNLGVASLAEQDCAVMIVSDASGQLNAASDPGGGIIAPLTRSMTVMMERIRGVEYAHSKARTRSRLLRNFTYVHLKQGLDWEDLDWRNARSPGNAVHASQGTPDTSYGVRKDVQARLAGLRTDLDSFSDTEAYALMTSGYLGMDQAMQKLEGFRLNEDRHAWKFLDIEPAMRTSGRGDGPISSAELLQRLEIGKEKFFRIWRMVPVLKYAAYAVGIALAAIVLAWLYSAWQGGGLDTSLVRTPPLNSIAAWTADLISVGLIVGILVTALIVWLAGFLFGRRAKKTVREVLGLRSLPRRLVTALGMGSVGWIGSWIHLGLFDRWFLCKGRLGSKHSKKCTSE